MNAPTDAESTAGTNPPENHAAPAASLPELFWIFFQIGAMSFGGGLSAWIHREIVTKRGWMSDTDFLTGLALCQVLPGVNNVNMAVHVGQRVRGVIGALTCVVAMLLAPFFAIIGLAAIYDQIKGIPWMYDLLDGVAAAAVGLLVSVALRSARGTFRGIAPFAIAFAFIVTVGILRWPMIPVVLSLAPLSVVLAYLTRKGGLLGGRHAG
jgi:chromate transporter